MKITSFTDFRTNFELDDLHYTINETDDVYESSCYMHCKETGTNYYFGYRYYSDVIRPFIKTYKYGATYSQRYDVQKLEQFVREILYGTKYEDTKVYLEEKENKRLRDIEYHIKELRKLGYDI